MFGVPGQYLFNPLRDIKQVESGLAVDITDALNTGVVKDTTYVEDYNGIQEPAAIVGRISDRFDAIEASRVVHKYGRKARVESYTKQDSSASAAPAAASGEKSE